MGTHFPSQRLLMKVRQEKKGRRGGGRIWDRDIRVEKDIKEYYKIALNSKQNFTRIVCCDFILWLHPYQKHTTKYCCTMLEELKEREERDI